MKDPHSVEYAWQTIYLLKTYYQDKTISAERWERELADAEGKEIYLRIPSPEKPYGSMDAMLRAEIGAGKAESLRNKAQQMAADDGVTAAGNVGNLAGKNQYSPKEESLSDKDSSQGDNYGTSASYLVRRLKRDHPDIARALGRGEYPSARAAGIAAGFVRVDTPLEALRKAWGKAGEAERQAVLAENGLVAVPAAARPAPAAATTPAASGKGESRRGA
jgi:hypothetical protein